MIEIYPIRKEIITGILYSDHFILKLLSEKKVTLKVRHILYVTNLGKTGGISEDHGSTPRG